MKNLSTLFLVLFTFFYSQALEYNGIITIDNGRGDTIINNASVILIEENDSVSFLIPNLRIEKTGVFLNVGNVYISNSKIFNLRGIKAVASEPLFTVTEGDMQLPDDQIWASIVFPPNKYIVSSLYDENDLILRFQFFVYQPDITFTIQFSTQGSNIPVIKGDINRDGHVNGVDIAELYNIILN